MGTQVTKARTPASSTAIYAALAQAWQTVVGTIPSRNSLLVLTAQSAFETGQWVSMWNNNLGNIKHVTGDSYDYIQLTCTEYNSAGVPSSSPCYFRAYDSLTAGASDFIQFLQGSRYASAWSAVLAGNPHTFVQQLSAAGYFTGPEAAYETGVVGYYTSYNASLPNSVPTSFANTSKSTGPSIWTTLFGGLILGGAAYLAYEAYALSPARRRRIA